MHKRQPHTRHSKPRESGAFCCMERWCAARRPAPAGAGRHGAAAAPPPAAYGEAVCGAPRKCADYAACGNGGVCRGGRGGGEIESRRACVRKNSKPKAAASRKGLSVAKRPPRLSSAAAAAFSMRASSKSPPKRRVFRTFLNRRRANRRTSLNQPPTCAARRPAPAGAGRHGAAAAPPPAAYGEAVCGAPRKCADYAACGNGGVCRGGRGGGEIESRRACVRKNSKPKAAASRKGLSVAKRPPRLSSAAAAAFSMRASSKSPPKRRVFRTFLNRRRANRRTSLNRPPTCAARRPAPAGRVGMGRLRRRQPHTALPYAARRALAHVVTFIPRA